MRVPHVMQALLVNEHDAVKFTWHENKLINPNKEKCLN